MLRFMIVLGVLFVSSSFLRAQPGASYAKDVRPFLTKYCLECHNAKTMKAGLVLETYKTLMEGSDRGPVINAGKPDTSLLVVLCEGKEKPVMPPVKARFQPTKEEIKLVRAWVAAGAKDDSTAAKVVLPAIKPRGDMLPPVTAVAYLPASQRLLIGRNQQLSLIELKNGDGKSVDWTLPGNVTALVAVSKVEAVVAAVSQAGERNEVFVFLAGQKPEKRIPIDHTDTLLDLAYHAGKHRFATASYDTQVRIIEGKSGKVQHVLKEHSDAVHGVAFNPDGSLLASVSADRAMKVTDVESGKLLYTLGEATDWLYAVAWSPNGKYLVAGGVDKSIRVYAPSATGAKLIHSVFGHQGPVQKVVFSSDSKTLYSVGQDRIVKSWDIEGMVERMVYEQQSETVLCLALREDVQQLIVGRYDGVVQLIDIKSSEVVAEFGKTEKAKKTSANHAAPTFLTSYQDEKTPNKSILAKDAGNSPATGQKVPLPATITGTLDRAGAVQFFRFDVKQGQSLGVKLATKEIDSKLDPVLILADVSGRVLRERTEGHLGHTFASDGAVAIGVRDREYRGGGDFKYRLQLGEIPVLSEIYPLGLQRGTDNLIQVRGVFLEQQSVRVKVPADAAIGSKIPVPITSSRGTPLGSRELLVGEYADTFESPATLEQGKRMTVPGTANGRISGNAEKHLWNFGARKGHPLIVEVNARRLGSRLDSVIEILDKDGQLVPRAMLRSQAKTYVTFRDHDSAIPGIRIEAWSELATNDFLYVGNELMKIQSLPTHPDADCNFFSSGGQRLGYLDTTPTHHSNNTPMYKVTLHPPGKTFPPNGYPVFTLHYRNDDGGAGYGRDSRLIFDPPADGEYKVRIADARGMGGENFGYRLTIRDPKPHFALRTTPQKPVVSRGSAIPITITAERIDGYDGPIRVSVKNLPPGLHMPSTVIEAGTFATTVALYADADAKLPAKSARPMLEGSTAATGSLFAFAGPLELPSLIDPGDIVTTTRESEVAIVPGQQTKLTVHIERRNGFTGRVPIDVKGLPHGVRVLDIGLNGILITERETTRTIVLYAEPWVQARDQPFVVLARREGKNTEHAARGVVLKVK